ncbi:unnamed protein product, partial [Mesorhabditis spiculigera]
MRLLLVLLALLATVSHAFYPNIYAYRYMDGLRDYRNPAYAPHIRDSGEKMAVQGEAPSRTSDYKVKRFRPCFYSPIQCLIKK